MKIVIASLLIASGILSGCVVEPAYRGDYHGGYGYRDGVPNRPDRDRDGVPNRADRDRDGDGVRNNHDRFPDNRRRY